MIPIALEIKTGVDTQSSLVQTGLGMAMSGLVRIKNGFVQKLGGCVSLTTTLHGSTANVLLPWSTAHSSFLVGIGTFPGLEVNPGAGASHDLTPAAAVNKGNWTLANWGEWLLAAYQTGTIYYWVPTFPLAGSGIAIAVSTLAGATGVPTAVNGVFVAAPQQTAFAWGIFSATLGAQDPLLIGWCDVANLQDWTASATNQAGSFKLSSGSLVVGATWTGLSGLFWTDLDLWAANYVQFPLVYGFNRVGENCGLISRQAWAKLGTRIVWMGQNDFYEYEGGAVRVVKCDVRDFIFNTLIRNGGTNLTVHADANSYGNEVTFRFSQTGDVGRCNAYVKWSPDEGNKWDVWADTPGGAANAMWLNSWSDQSFVHPPLGIDYSGHLLQFERSGNAPLLAYNGAALNSFLVTGWFYLAEGQQTVTVERVNPDFVWVTNPNADANPSSAVQMTFYFADEIPSLDTNYPIRTYGPYTVTPETPYIIVNGSGRVMQIRIECTSATTFWRSGKHMAMVAIDGRS